MPQTTALDPRWQAVLDRSPAADFVFAVRTTGIYCRPSCPARRPRPENVSFHANAAEAEAQGYRPCLRCHPTGIAPAQANADLVAAACRILESADPVPTLPELARRIRAEDHAGGQSAYSRATEFGLFLTLPAAFAIAVIAEPMVRTLFERGEFTAYDTTQTARALIVYAFGLPAFVLQKILQPLYFAREDTKTPFRYALWSMVVNAIVAFGLMPWLGFLAAALGTTVAAWIMVAQLWWGTRAMGDAARADDRLRRKAPLIILSSSLMAGALWLMMGWLDGAGIGRVPGLLILVFGGAAIYFALSFATRAYRLSDLKAAVRRG